MSFKDISHLELWWPFIRQLCYSRGGHHEEHFCEITLNLDQCFRRCRLKDFLSRALAALMFSGPKRFMQLW